MNDMPTPADPVPAEPLAPSKTTPAASSTWRTVWPLLAVFLLVAAAAWAATVFLRGIPLGTPSAGVSGSAPAPMDAPTSAGGAPAAKPVKALTDEQLDRMIGQVSEQTRKEPKNASAWAMLAHTYEMRGKFKEASQAFATLAELVPKDAQVLADYADALAVANGRSFKGEPMRLIERSLAVDPKNAKALALAAAAHQDEKAYDKAISYWERALAVTQDPDMVELIQSGLAQARVLSGKGPAPGAAGASSAPAKPVVMDPNAKVSGTVTVAGSVKAQLPKQGVLYVFARPAEGSRMPVALLKKQVTDLPLEFVLDDAAAMVPGVGLSSQKEVVVVARISANGNVTAAPGDLQGISARVPVGQKGIKLEINEVLK